MQERTTAFVHYKIPLSRTSGEYIQCCEPLLFLDVHGWVPTLAGQWHGLGGRGIGVVGQLLGDFI